MAPICVTVQMDIQEMAGCVVISMNVMVTHISAVSMEIAQIHLVPTAVNVTVGTVEMVACVWISMSVVCVITPSHVLQKLTTILVTSVTVFCTQDHVTVLLCAATHLDHLLAIVVMVTQEMAELAKMWMNVIVLLVLVI